MIFSTWNTYETLTSVRFAAILKNGKPLYKRLKSRWGENS